MRQVSRVFSRRTPPSGRVQRRRASERNPCRPTPYNGLSTSPGNSDKSTTEFSVPNPQSARLAVRRGLPVRPVADQLLVRTMGEMARRQEGGTNP